jgi:hypothetical protein
MDKAGLEALLARIDIWLVVFGAVVVVGVAGESFFGVRHWWNSRKLQALQNAESEAQHGEIARLNNETAKARDSAAKAEAQATQAGEGTAKALANAAAANERAGKLELEAASQRERAAKAEHDLLEIQERLAPRRITASQQGKLTADLRSLALRKVVVLTVSLDPETVSFGDLLTDALKSAGLNAERVSHAILGSVASGISMQVGNNRTIDSKILAFALVDAGLAAKPVPFSYNVGDAELLQLIVGPKN